jgi:hypothetical protein
MRSLLLRKAGLLEGQRPDRDQTSGRLRRQRGLIRPPLYFNKLNPALTAGSFPFAERLSGKNIFNLKKLHDDFCKGFLFNKTKKFKATWCLKIIRISLIVRMIAFIMAGSLRSE